MIKVDQLPNVLAVIPARGGSKGISRKNIKLLAGIPLIKYSVRAAIDSQYVTRIIVSTDDKEIAEIALECGAEVIMRPDDLAQDKSPTLPVIHQVLEALKSTDDYIPDLILTLQPTSPLRTSEHIDEAIELIHGDRNADSLVSVIEVPHIYHPNSIMKRDGNGYLVPYSDEFQITRRQEKSQVFARNGAAIYLTRIDKIKDYIFGGKLLSFPMDAENSIDIDDMSDFEHVEKILLSRK